ncbi:lysophospholipid acyltransferase family protein [Amphibiibacter pelophylacis]|uniref:Lysophospholipid acyltransferase family protein n=1 Tax=Amphibiibacter pelophylacis TaxID=1799477 RepID=A0ACC6P269_9BURK
MPALFRLLSRWPLPLLHFLGAGLGWIVWAASPRYRQRLQENAAQAGLTRRQWMASVAHAGRMTLETPRLWLGEPVPLYWRNADLLEAAYAQGRGVVMMTPHMGAFETLPQGVALRCGPQHGDLTVLYRPARQAWLAGLMRQARQREHLRAVPTDLSGVRQMIRALRQGQAVGLLPDQVPPEGMGVWSRFFGREAYTMTLAARLIQQTGAIPVLMRSERLPRGAGFAMHVQAFPGAISPDLETAVQQINDAIEGVIRQCPQQYLWGYARYKAPGPVRTAGDAA